MQQPPRPSGGRTSRSRVTEARGGKGAPAPGSGARRTRTEANLERLLTAASNLMAHKGYEQTSIRDVARETGISLAGMYYYFKGKEEMLYQIQFRTFGSLLEEQERIAADGGTPEQKLRGLVVNHLSYLTTHANELKVCTFELESLQGDYYKGIEKLRRRYFKLIAGLVAELMGQPKGQPEKDINIRHHSLFLFGMLNWVFMWFDARRDSPTEKLGNKMVDFLLRGIPGGTAAGA